MSYLGAIEDTGASPYQIKGDPVTALVAQLNRFAGKSVAPGSCGAARLVADPPFPVAPVLDDRAVSSAALIVWRRYSCVSIDVWSKTKEKWAADALFGSNTRGWVMSNLAEITTTIAQFGDSLGLGPASVGITTLDPKMTPKFPTMTVVALGLLAVGAVVVSRRKR
jgi:hypothetical protein